ncbi:MAG: hypothetical protein Q4B72_06715 [Lachnospiraceae bacterium]|nr:hypothetical protein [Lachnospiraceae bacterium]
MFYKCLCGNEIEKNELQRQRKEARYLAEIRLGTEVLFYTNLIWVRYIAYDQIANLYLKMERGESGEFLTIENYLILCDINGKEHSMRIEQTDIAREVMRSIREEHPDITNIVPGR